MFKSETFPALGSNPRAQSPESNTACKATVALFELGYTFTLLAIGVRANIHLGGGGRPSFARMDSVEGGVVAEIFRDPYSGGGGSSRNFPGSIFWGGG